MSDPADRRPPPDQAGPGLRLRQDRPRRPRPRPARGRRRARLHRLDRRPGSPTPGVPVTKVEDLTGFPECLDGRVKTLHPQGARRHPRRPPPRVPPRRSSRSSASSRSTWSSRTSTRSPRPCARGAVARRVRRADRHRRSVDGARRGQEPPVGRDRHLARRSTTTCWPPSRDGGFTLAQRQRLAAEAFVHTATYDVHVASWMGNVLTDTSEGSRLPGLGRRDLGQGGGAALRREPAPAGRALHRRLRPEGGLAQAEQLHGKEMSYNNYVDADAARRAAYDFDEPAVAIIKHANPCGIAVGADVAEAHRKAHACDPVSRVRRRDRHQPSRSRSRWPSRSRRSSPRSSSRPATRTAPSRCWPGRRTSGSSSARPRARGGVETRPISGGLLMQARDAVDAVSRAAATTRRPGRWRPATPATEQQLADLAFAWRACRAVKSNAILLASDGASVGVGMGQVNRVDSCRLAVERAGERAAGSVAASRRVLPVRGRPADPGRRRGRGDRAARRLGPRRGGRRGA